MLRTPRVALVHESLAVTGGAERLLLSLCTRFPDAPIYTAVHRPDTTLPAFRDRNVRPLWTDRLPVDNRTYRAAFLPIAIAFERLDLADYDLVISTSSGFAKNAGRRAGARICICLTPPRYLWPCGVSSDRGSRVEKIAARALAPALRPLDLAGAARVTEFIAISRLVADRISRFYGRNSRVIYPPVDLAGFSGQSRRRAGFLTVGRLIGYKGFDQVIAACEATGRDLRLIGAGRDEARLRAMAGPRTEFAGRVSDIDLVAAYGSARALIVPGEEDWGLTPIEANACGCPVIAAARGGSLESVIDGVTGILYDPDQVDGLARALERFDRTVFSEERLRAHAEGFSEERFQMQLDIVVAAAISASPPAASR